MIRKFLALATCLWGCMAVAQEFSALARVDLDNTRISDTRTGVRIELGLSQGVPFRVFTLDDPRRLVMDFREVDWRGVDPKLLDWSDGVSGVRVGGFVPGWSRMVVDLTAPYAVKTADAEIEAESGTAQIEINLIETTAEAFSESAGIPPLPGWDLPENGLPAVARARQTGEERLVVMLDPGHGGIDPGAESDGLAEKDLMLTFALELREVLLRSGEFDVVLTREDDGFVSLERRVALAHQAGADLMVSLHADALSEGHAHGSTVYTLSESASDLASAALAERHDRADLLSGVDLTEADDVIADVLMDLARMETHPRADQLAKSIRAGVDSYDLPLNSKPMRSAGFSVLKSPDIPSVLFELGFMSSERDLENLKDPEWRGRMAEALRDALIAWRIADAASAKLVRQ